MSRYDDIKLEILYAIYEDAFREGSSAAFQIDQLHTILPRKLILGVTRAIIQDLRSERYLDYLTNEGFAITSTGIRFIELELEDQNSRLSEIVRERDQGVVGTAIPASDRRVNLDHNSDPYREAIAALDAALQTFKEDRLLENEWGPEKGALIQTIEAGRELLKQGEVQVATMFATIIAPLQVIREKYEHAIVAGLVTAGADQLVSSLGHAVTLLLRLFGMA